MKSFLIIALVANTISLGVFAQNIPESRIDSIFSAFNRPNSPGCAVAIIKDGKTVLEKGYGLANLEYNLPIDGNTVFDIASVSKQFTGFAISTLIQEGRISLDDDIHKWLPDIPQFDKKITISHLVHHTSGLRDWPLALHYAGWRWDEIFSFQDIMRFVHAQKDLNFDPGAQYSYSNTGYNLLAATVEKVTGKPFRIWMAEHVFQPLGMTSTVVSDNYNTIIKNRAPSYFPTDTSFGFVPGALTAYGSSSIFSSVHDLAKWVIHFNAAIAANDPIYTRMLQQDTTNNGQKQNYAFGLDINHNQGVYSISHTGGWAGYNTVIINFPDANLSVIILGNVNNFDPTGYAFQIARLYMPGKIPTAPKREDLSGLPTAQVDTTKEKAYLGTFQLGIGWYVTFTLEKGKFLVQANGENQFPTEAKSDTVFWVPGYGSSFTFMRSEDGQYNKVRYRGITARRVVPVTYDTKALTGYTGTYYSPELEVYYRISLNEGRLSLHQARLGDFPLEPDPAIADQMTCSLGSLCFEKDEKKGITGFRISNGRVQRLRFDRL